MTKARAPYPSEAAEKYVVRFPDGMRDQIAAAAKRNQRTMNAEIVARLAASFATAEHVTEEAYGDLANRAIALDKFIAATDALEKLQPTLAILEKLQPAMAWAEKNKPLLATLEKMKPAQELAERLKAAQQANPPEKD